MDMFNKLKAKLAEEMDSESEQGGGVPAAASHHGASSSSSSSWSPSNGPASGKSAAALEREVSDLKEHINKNYFVFVKRLEKRKERIRELEEYAKLVIKDNEALEEKVKGYEQCQKQLSECRDQLEQLEGFQSQELSKVKHMLLSAETALEAEKKERRRREEQDGEEQEREGQRKAKEAADKEKLQAEIDSLKSAHESKLLEMRQSHEAQIARLEERLSHQDLSGDERLDAVVKERDTLESELQASKKSYEDANSQHSTELASLQRKLDTSEVNIADLQSQLTASLAERDAAKNQVLELEIANHESQASVGSEREKVKLDLAKVATEKETLEMTLELRDKELKAKKEEFRKDLAKSDRAREESLKEIQSKSVRISALEAELLHLKNKLAEESNNLLIATSNIDKLESSVSFLEETLQIKDKNVTSMQRKVDEETQKAAQMAKEYAEMKRGYDVMEREHGALTDKVERLMQEREGLIQSADVAAKRCSGLEEDAKDLKATLADREATFDARVERTETVRGLRRRVQEMEDELSDKKKLIRLHNQRMNDMKKTFQREIRGPSAEPPVANGTRSPSPPYSSVSPGPTPSASSTSLDMPMTASSDLVLMSETNFKYLKHVIFKFFTSKDYEAKKHLTKAMSALLQFTPEEEKLFQDHLDWGVSWFGAKPKPGSGQFSTSIDKS